MIAFSPRPSGCERLDDGYPSWGSTIYLSRKRQNARGFVHGRF